MNRWHLVLPVLFLGLALSAEVRTVDLLKARGFSVNAAGPLLVRADPPRGRIVMANTVTASLTLVDEASHRVENVLKSLGEGELDDLAIDGNLVVTCEFCNNEYRFALSDVKPSAT